MNIVTTHHADDKIALEKCDLLVANILANPLMALEPTFSVLVRENGSIVISVILDEQLDMVLEAYRANFNNIEV